MSPIGRALTEPNLGRLSDPKMLHVGMRSASPMWLTGTNLGQQGRPMLLAHGVTVSSQPLEVTLVIITILAVIFWRTSLRLLVVLLAVLFVCGAVALIEQIHHLIG